MLVDNLTPGTKLMWDADEPFPGYAKKIGMNGNRVIYPCIVTNKRSKNPYLTVHIITERIGNWMSGDIPYLRFPTEEELNTLTFPNPEIV